MIIDSQRLDFKISTLDHRYSRKVQENLSASRETFCDLETPGWTSLMRSEISQRTKRNMLDKQPLNPKQKSIFNRLNEVKNLEWSQKDQQRMLKQKQGDKNETRDTDYAKPQSLAKRPPSQPQPQSNPTSKPKPSRWNQISVHEHLYQNSHKLENKKMINKILDEEYKKTIFKFTPTINKKSVILAESKFSRAKQNEAIFSKEENTIQTQATDVREKEDKEVERYRILNKTFYFLSEGKTILTEQSLQNSILSLPMPCLKVIQSIVSQIYQGQQMQWLDFLENFNDKSVKGKQGFYAIMTKWFSRNDPDKNMEASRKKQ